MQSFMFRSISVIGTGNVAWHLVKMFGSLDIPVSGIAGRNESKLKEFGNEFGIEGTLLKENYTPKGDIVFIAVTDSAIKEVISMINPTNSIIVHCSASTSADIFSGKFERYGVFYLYQTFTKGSELNYHEIPVILEANNEDTLNKLNTLAVNISDKIYFLNLRQRRFLHLAGIMACNFTNHMYNLSFKIMEDNKIDTALLLPLIKSTARKVEDMHPGKAQTGPAYRGDTQIMMDHLKLLESYSDIKEIYLHISESIAKYKQKEKDS